MRGSEDKVEHLCVFGIVHVSDYAYERDLSKPTLLSPIPKLKGIKYHEVDRESVNAMLEVAKYNKDMVFDMKGDTYSNLTVDIYLKPQVGSKRVVRYDRPPTICLQSICWGEDYEV